MSGGRGEFHYRARFHARSLIPGAHASRVRGSGQQVAALVPLAQGRDTRRLDLRASLRDPFGQWWVREFEQRASIAVVAMVDLSASMALGPADAARAFVAALADSAARVGDAFGLLPFGDVSSARPVLRPTRVRAAAGAALGGLDAAAFDAPSAGGLGEACAQLPRQPALVFLVSDFQMPPAAVDDALGRMARHDVVPVWLRDPADPRTAPRFGLVELRDAESGRRRVVWMRPAVREAWLARRRAHEAALAEVFARHDTQALVIAGTFDADAVTDHFAAR